MNDIRGLTVKRWGHARFVVNFTLGSYGKRFHFMLNDAGEPEGVMYENPPAHKRRGDHGWFETRKHEVGVNKGHGLFTIAISTLISRGLIDKAREEHARALAREHEEITDQKKLARAHAAGPQLYDAIKAFLACQERGIVDFKVYQLRRTACYDALKLVDEE